MSTYQDDHNITNQPTPEPRQRTHQTLASAIEMFLAESQDATPTELESFANALRRLRNEEGSELASELLESLQTNPEFREKKGIDDSYLDSLDRVDISKLDDDADCPICTNKYKDDKYPLVVRLPCSSKHDHMFDLECIGPWLKMNSTCPLCRFDLLELNAKRKERLDRELEEIRAQDEDEEEEDWDVYG